MGKGVIIRKIEEKGFGFIKSSLGDSIFFHINAIGKENFEKFKKGDSVQFETIETPKGKQATNMSIYYRRLDGSLNFNKKVDFSEEQIRDMFGDLAAEDETLDRFKSYFIKTDTYDKIHNSLPIRILVAHKGIGKSAIFRMSYIENQKNNNLSLWVKPDDISNLGKTDGEIDPLELIRHWKNGLNELIVDKVMNNFELNNDDAFTTKIMSKGVRLAEKIATIVKKASEIADVDEIKRVVAENYIRNKKIIIYIDDLDRAWNGSKQNIYRISALLNAIRDMCSESNELCFRISLRSDVYYLVRTADESTDKIDGNVLWLRWTEHELLALLTKRIQSFFNLDNNESLLEKSQKEMSKYLNGVMESTFEGDGKWNNRPIRYILLSLIRRRPRDLVNLCTLAARNASANSRILISTNDWEDIFGQYSLSRLQDTINEHRYELPDIERLLLGMKPSHDNKKTDKPYVFNTEKLIRKVEGIMQNEKFYFINNHLCSAEELISFMYKINFIVARKDLKNGFIDRKYFEDNKYITSTFVDFGYDWEVHPAFRWALYPEAKDVLLYTEFPDFS